MILFLDYLVKPNDHRGNALAIAGSRIPASNLKMAFLIPLHFAPFFLNEIISNGMTINGLQSACYPTACKMATRGVTPSVFCEPPGNMMAGRAHNVCRVGSDLFKMDDA